MGSNGVQQVSADLPLDGSGRGSPGELDVLDVLDARLREKERAENFPVALRLLPAAHRRHLAAVYDVVRVIDDLGDEAHGDRTALLTAFGEDVATLWRGGTPRAGVLQRLESTRVECALPQAPFDNLVRANLMDQKVDRYATYPDLVDYCRLSADPIGRIVLAIFGMTTPEREVLSDRVCTALQIIEHCQDIAEDRRAGRIYLPQEDLAAFDVPESDLDRPDTSPALRRLVEFQIERASALLASGAPLVGTLRGWGRLAVAGYVAGGRAAIDRLRRSGWEIMSGSPGTSRLTVVRHVGGLILRKAAS
jgi:squalene synthase HpnC